MHARDDWEAPMITSRDRILTTHVGSLPRNEVLSDLLVKREAGEAYDKARIRRGDGQGRAPCGGAAEGAPASTSATTASSSGSASRPTCRQRMSGFARRVQAPARARVRGVPRAGELPVAPLPAHQQAAERAGMPGRAALPRHCAAGGRDRPLQEHRRGRGRLRRRLHDGAVARHHRLDHAQRALRLARGLSRGHRARDEERVPGDPPRRA